VALVALLPSSGRTADVCHALWCLGRIQSVDERDQNLLVGTTTYAMKGPNPGLQGRRALSCGDPTFSVDPWTPPPHLRVQARSHTTSPALLNIERWTLVRPPRATLGGESRVTLPRMQSLSFKSNIRPHYLLDKQLHG